MVKRGWSPRGLKVRVEATRGREVAERKGDEVSRPGEGWERLRLRLSYLDCGESV